MSSIYYDNKMTIRFDTTCLSSPRGRLKPNPRYNSHNWQTRIIHVFLRGYSW